DRLEKSAGGLGECDQAITDRVRKAAGARRRERQHLQAMRQHVAVTVRAAIFDVVMDRMVVAGEQLKRREMRRRHGAARIAKDFPDPQVFETAGLRRREPREIECIVHAGRHRVGASLISTSETAFTRLFASTKFPSLVTEVLRTMLPPPGMTQLWNFSLFGSNRTTELGFVPDSLYQITS